MRAVKGDHVCVTPSTNLIKFLQTWWGCGVWCLLSLGRLEGGDFFFVLTKFGGKNNSQTGQGHGHESRTHSRWEGIGIPGIPCPAAKGSRGHARASFHCGLRHTQPSQKESQRCKYQLGCRSQAAAPGFGARPNSRGHRPAGGCPICTQMHQAAGLVTARRRSGAEQEGASRSLVEGIV